MSIPRLHAELRPAVLGLGADRGSSEDLELQLRALLLDHIGESDGDNLRVASGSESGETDGHAGLEELVSSLGRSHHLAEERLASTTTSQRSRHLRGVRDCAGGKTPFTLSNSAESKRIVSGETGKRGGGNLEFPITPRIGTRAIQPKNAYADAANRRDGVRERQSLDRRSISYCGGGTRRVGLRRSLRMWRRFSTQYVEVDSSERATPRYSVMGHMRVRSERTRVPKGELTLGRYLTDS